MKPNGNQFVVRSFAVALFAVGLLSSFGNAETMHGTFKLPVQARWGTMLLAPGDYEFSVDTRSGGSMVTVRSIDSRWSGMAMSRCSSGTGEKPGSGLTLNRDEGMTYVKALYLGDLRVELNFATPKLGKATKVAKSQTATMASASGNH
jgi:hypothetical protein